MSTTQDRDDPPDVAVGRVETGGGAIATAATALDDSAPDHEGAACPCCAGTGRVQWPPVDRPACSCALDARDRRPVELQRRVAYLQRVMSAGQGHWGDQGDDR